MSKYTNRYGDVFTFELNERGNIDWKGNFKYCSIVGPYDDNRDVVVDPSGGPYIAIGNDMGEFSKEFSGMKVYCCIWRDDHYEIVIDKNGQN